MRAAAPRCAPCSSSFTVLSSSLVDCSSSLAVSSSSLVYCSSSLLERISSFADCSSSLAARVLDDRLELAAGRRQLAARASRSGARRRARRGGRLAGRSARRPPVPGSSNRTRKLARLGAGAQRHDLEVDRRARRPSTLKRRPSLRDRCVPARAPRGAPRAARSTAPAARHLEDVQASPRRAEAPGRGSVWPAELDDVAVVVDDHAGGA